MISLSKASLLVLGLTAACIGCGDTGPPLSVPVNAREGDFSTERFRWRTGAMWNNDAPGFDAERGVIIVPENRRKTGSRLIALPFVRIHATVPTREPVMILGGGPGSPNILKGLPDWAIELLAAHDLVMPGYRGAEGSTVLDCPEITGALKGTGGDLLGAAARARIVAAMSESARRLRRNGVDLEGYTIDQVAADCEAIRSGLGYERVNLVSLSYGTRVAQVFARQYPERVRRSAMIGVNPPGHFLWEPASVDSLILRYSALWGKDSLQRSRTPDLAGTIKSVVASMPRRWFLFPIDRGKVRVVTFAMMFHRNSAAMTFDAYADAGRGDAAGLALMSVAYDFIMPSMSVWGDFFAKGGTDYDSTRSYAAEMDPPGSIIGSPFSLLIWPAAASPGAWPIVLLPDSLRRVGPSDVETLLVSGNLDASTPAEAATKEMLPVLRRGRQVVLADMGHCNDLTGAQPEAFAHLLGEFLARGVVDTSQFAPHPMKFHTGMGLAGIARIIVAVLVVLAAAFVVLAWYVVSWLVGEFRSRRSVLSQ